MAPSIPNRTIEDITIAFRNFAGKEDMYNRAGDRNFAVLLEPNLAAEMAQEGWNVRYLRERDEGDGSQAYIQVAVSFKTRPPKVVLVTSRGKTYLTEDEIETLDWVDIQTADVTLNPYEWAVGDKNGVKAYLRTLFIRIEEDYLEMKWDAIIEETRQITSGQKDYIDGELVEDALLIEGAR
jgi:hypothetical protein